MAEPLNEKEEAAVRAPGVTDDDTWSDELVQRLLATLDAVRAAHAKTREELESVVAIAVAAVEQRYKRKLATARDEALEEAARVVDRAAAQQAQWQAGAQIEADRHATWRAKRFLEEAAAAIRALKGKHHG